MQTLLDAYAVSRSPAQHTRLTVPACRLTQTHGGPDSRRLFVQEDYIELLLHRYCTGA